MSTNFSILEMLKIAILTEEEGRNFYLNGAKHTSGKVKDFLTMAAGQELMHKEKFEKLFNDYSNKTENDLNSDYLYDAEVSEYLRKLIENKAFKKNDVPENAFDNLRSAVESALNSEKLTVELYTNMYKGILSNEVKEMFNIIIEEEKEHVNYFSKLLEEIA
ncbi:Rubrerythrin [Hathewaya proteolytica DSM 3090]|uniref:Rubrerythrin n=1 Tax=Hathewaya proteolytica DSM 3090 TaxID=1121331 RepID=A0A1M6M0G7_9CLOT|nr:ferritin family protein [Hathewaya proteolytica]SHJ76971.1 Rubrerythrin [Hathewaya proteolytica DSM 3090]